MIKVTIKVHEHYVQTIVRMHGIYGTSYVEYAACGVDLPRRVLGEPTNDAIVDTFLMTDNGTNSLPGFLGYFEMEIAIGEEQTTVEKARYITKERGARDVTEAYQHPELGDRMRQSLFEVLADKNVEKLNETLGAVADAWG